MDPRCLDGAGDGLTLSRKIPLPESGAVLGAARARFKADAAHRRRRPVAVQATSVNSTCLRR